MAIGFIVLSLMAAIGYAAGNIADKLLMAEYVEQPAVKAVGYAVIAPLLAAPLIVLGRVTFPGLQSLVVLLIAGASLLLSTIVFMRAMQNGEVSRLALLLQTAPLFALIFSLLLFGTVLTMQQFAGVAVLMLAAFLAALEHPAEGLPRFQFNQPFWYAIIATVLFAFSAVLVQYALAATTVWTAVYWQYLGMFLTALPFIAYQPVRQETVRIVRRRQPLLLLAAGSAAYVSAQVAFTAALEQVAVAVVTAVVTISPLFVLLFVTALQRIGFDQFEERLSRLAVAVKVLAVLLFVAGVYLVK